MGALIFADDYFNCLTVGTVMKPVTDRHKISREKLAYIIDSTAAPVCIIAPISSWAVSVGSTIQDAGIEDGFGTFISTIPFNYYAILTILMLGVLGVTRLDFGSMRRYESQAQAGHIETAASDAGNLGDIEISKKGRVFDLVIPIVSLIVITLLAMLYTGGLFTGGASSILEAFGNTDANTSLVWGGFAFVRFITKNRGTAAFFLQPFPFYSPHPPNKSFRRVGARGRESFLKRFPSPAETRLLGILCVPSGEPPARVPRRPAP